VPAHDLTVAQFHDRHERVHHDLARVEHPLLGVLRDDEVPFRDRVARMVVIAGERLDAELQPGDDLRRSGGTDAVDPDVGVVRRRREERGHAIPVAREVRLPVPLDDLAVLRFQRAHAQESGTRRVAAFVPD